MIVYHNSDKSFIHQEEITMKTGISLLFCTIVGFAIADMGLLEFIGIIGFSLMTTLTLVLIIIIYHRIVIKIKHFKLK